MILILAATQWGYATESAIALFTNEILLDINNVDPKRYVFINFILKPSLISMDVLQN